VGLHIALLAAAARGHRKRHGNARPQRRIKAIARNHRSELVYRAALLQLVGRCRSIIEADLDEMKAYWPRPTTGDSVRAADSPASPTRRLINKAKAKLGPLDIWSRKMAGLAAEANKINVDKRLAREIHKAVGVDVSHILRANGTLLQAMQKAVHANVDLIKTIPEQYFDRVYETVTSSWVQGARWETMVEQIQRDGNITENRAKLIARDQTAKMNSSFNQERQQSVGIERYRWMTAEDERVRGDPSGKYPDADPSHYDYERMDNGMGPGVFRWDSPPEDGHPGQGINCRCVAQPIIDMEETAQAVEEAA
jgi:uncharacterized protein with gpF-like domain